MKIKKALCAVMAGVTALTSVVMTVPAAAEGQSYNGLEYEVDGPEITITKYTGSDSSVYIPDMIDGRKVVKIEKEAFSGNETIEHVRFPAYLEEIWDSAFKECSSLQEAVFPASMTYIGLRAFYDCTSISDIVFGSAVEMSFTFIGCDNVEDISLYPSESYNYNDYHHDISFNCQNLSNVYYFGEAPNQGDSFTDMFPGWTTRDYYALKSDNEKIAEFDPKSTHSIVTFDPNSGTGGTKLYALKDQQVSEPVPPEKKDCEFVGWYTNPEGKGEPWDFVMDKVSSDTTLYAKYRPLQFSVTFDAQGGSCDVKQKDYSFGLAMGELPVPTRANYTFIGWYTRADGNGDLYTEKTVMPRSDTKLYAAWLQDGKSLVVNFDGNGGEVDSNMALVPYKGKISAFPTATRTGYSFIGWNTSKDGSGDAYGKNTVVTRNNVTLYAIWQVNTMTITLDPKPGKLEQTKVYADYDAKIGGLPVPKRSGYEFMGWYYSNGSKFSESDTMPAKDITLTAKWRGFEYMILFDASKGNVTGGTKNVSCGDTVGKLPVPTRKGYEFLGWYTKPNGKGKPFTADYVMPEKDITVYAKWKKITAYASSVKIDAGRFNLAVGQTTQLSAVTTPELTLDKLKWTSSDSKIAAVNSKGEVVGKSAGTATIKVTTTKGKTASVKVTVKKAVTKLTSAYSSRTIKKDQTIKANITATGYAGPLTWTSSSNSVAIVDEKGNITGISAGKAVITARAFNGVKTTITITVK